jgi:aspartyl-tRNA(Asn)/glutamyl-tRNA(Gln) amidotransferase subunit B
MSWETVIGLEVHVQLATQSKIFSGSSTAFGADPNTQASAIDLALPGTLPVPNAKAFEYAVMFGLAVNAKIGTTSHFERKNYFYPDLPKGYQTTQLEQPIVGAGHVDINLSDGSTKRVRIHHAHLEEDAGKSLHEDFHGMSGIDLNRAGTPLIEIVSEPDMSNAEEAVAFAKHLHALVRWHRAQCASTSTFLYVAPANRLAHVPKLKTSTPSGLWKKPSNLKWNAK